MSLSHPTSTPLHDTFYVMISVTFERQVHVKWPLLLQVDVAGGWVYKNQYQNEYQMVKA